MTKEQEDNLLDDSRHTDPPLAPSLVRPFHIKLLQLWVFPDLRGSEDWMGIWETRGVREMGTEKENWEIWRVMVTGEGQTLGESRKNLPAWIFLKYGEAIKLTTIYSPNSDYPTNG